MEEVYKEYVSRGGKQQVARAFEETHLRQERTKSQLAQLLERKLPKSQIVAPWHGQLFRMM